jgi:hypothetical protein
MNSNLRFLLRAVTAIFALVGIASLITSLTSTAQLAATSTAPTRGYYVGPPTGGIDGSHPKTSCASGYHMASLYEILDPTVLTYRKGLGYTQADDGAGPPIGVLGWVRTGNVSASGSATQEGFENCKNWTSNSSADYGTAVWIIPFSDNIGGNHYSVGPWDVTNDFCSTAIFVWCVQN